MLARSRILLGFAGALLLAGCASDGLEIRSLPPATPAADNAAAAANAAALAAAMTDETTNAAAKATANAAAPDVGKATVDTPPLFTPADAPSMRTYDPFERLNRFTYRFNARFDDAIFLPLANGYRRLPLSVQTATHNFFANLDEVKSVINYVLQFRLHYAVRTLGRFVVNSTIGIGGLIDVAKDIKMPRAQTGFSDTLATYGVHPGPYLVIPLLGPSTLRDGIGFAGDYGINWAVNLGDLYRGSYWKAAAIDVPWAVDARANVDFRYYATGSPFEYQQIRFLYVRKRLIEDSGLRRYSRPTPPPAGTEAGQ